MCKSWDAASDKYNQNYAQTSDPVYFYEETINTVSLLGMLSSVNNISSILDVGCGVGTFTRSLKSISSNVDALDNAPNMLETAQRLVPGVNFFQKDIVSLDFSMANKYDLISLKLVLMYISDLPTILSNIKNYINPGGYVLVSVTHPARWYTCYLEDKHNVRERPSFSNMKDGYFSEVFITKSIGGDPALTFEFKHRTVSTYLESFLSKGFVLRDIAEPQVTAAFLEKYPDWKLRTVPLRLNMLFQLPT